MRSFLGFRTGLVCLLASASWVIAASSELPAQTLQAKQNAQSQPGQKIGRSEEESSFYKRWIDEDVRWIITDEELAAWKKLTTDAQRDPFIEAFWARRDPTPDTEENEYREEHYRRIMYANERFGAGVPGWRTDRGRMYIMYGKPDSIDAHPKSDLSKRAEEGSGNPETYPFEVWHYRYLEGIGQEIEVEFGDTCGCGEYHMTLDRSEKEPLLHARKVVPPEIEPMRMANKADGSRGGTPAPGSSDRNAKQPDRIESFTKPRPASEVKFKDLQAVVNTKVRYNLLPIDVRMDFVRVTADTVLVPITLQVPNSALTFVNKDGVQRATLNIFGRWTMLTGKIVETFEEQLRLDVPAELLEKVRNNVALYWKVLPMRPGRYRLDVVAKDVNGDKLGTWGQSVQVPEFEENKLAASTLIFADVLESVPSREVGAGSFVLGTTKVRPKLAAVGRLLNFKRDLNPKVNFWMQVYNLAIDEKTKRPSATVEYQVVNTSNNQSVVDLTESTERMEHVSDQLTLQKSLPTSKLGPGTYQITIKVTDLITKQSISPTASFAIE